MINDSEKTICFEFSGRQFRFKNLELLDILKSIKPTLRKNHDREIKSLIQNWPSIISSQKYHFSFRNDNNYYKVKELLFFYHIRDEMIKNKIWLVIDMPNLKQEEINDLKERAKKFGEYRYDVDNGWIGILAQDLFFNFLKNQNIAFQECQDVPLGDIDDFDVMIKGIKIDIKCATQDNYIEITPKVIVESNKKKDFYIALKFFTDINKFAIIGYFQHDELGNYPFKVLYGAAFWGVKLYNAKPISQLLEKIKNE